MALDSKSAKSAKWAKRSRFRTRLGLTFGALVIALLLVECAVRVRQYLRHGTTAISVYELVHDPVSGLDIPAPNSSVGSIRINSLGFRGGEIEMPKPPGRIRLAFLGGSTTFCAEIASVEMNWPHRVARALERRHPGCTFDHINGGTAGYSTAQCLLNLRHRIAPLDPDAIVIYEATNDLTQDSRELAAKHGLYDPNETEAGWLGKISLTWYLLEKNLRFRSRNEADRGGTLELDPKEISPAFRIRLAELVTEAKKVAPVVVLVTFSHRARREQSPEERRRASSSSLYYMPFLEVEGILAGFEEYNRVIREVALATDVVLVEGENTIPGDAAHFFDSVHFTEQGCALQAERVLQGLEAFAAFQALLEKRRVAR